MLVLTAGMETLMLVKDKPFVKVNVSRLSRILFLLEIPKEFSSFQALPDYKPDTA